MQKLIFAIAQDWQEMVAFMPRLLAALIVLVGFYFLGKYFSKIVISLLRKSYTKDIQEAFFRTLITTIALFFGLIVALNIVGLQDFAISVLAGGGVTAIVLGFAFREIGENFLAGVFLAFSRPFKIGDLILSEGIEGKVQDIELRHTHLRTEDGRDVYVPSSQLFGKPLTNFTKDGLRRIGFSVGIDYSNDSKRACAVLQAAIRNLPGVLQNPEADAYILALTPQYVEIQVFFWVDVFARDTRLLTIRTNVMDQCRKTLLEEGYTISADTTANIALANRPARQPGT